MQEKSVTVAGKHHTLQPPFFVMATQNPLEMEGTYPLPEAQLDRFFFKLKVEYPSLDELDLVMERTTKREMPAVEKVCDGERINALEQIVRDILIAEDVRRYALRIVLGTHPDSADAPELTKKYVRYGSSPRGAQALILGGKVKAILDNRYNVAREDIQAVALPSLRHRLILNFEGEAEGIDPDGIVQHLLAVVQ
jgi:MoxR-like ATPase